MEQPKLQFAFELRVHISQFQEIGSTAKGIRRIIPIIGGNFEGPHIKGTIARGGYDWQLLRVDGVAEVEARYLLNTDDGALITITNTGLRHGPADVMQRLSKGEDVDPSLYYFRSIPYFETSEPKYIWLMKNMFLANGVRKPAEVIISVWKIL